MSRVQEWTEKELRSAINQRDTFCLYAYTPMCGTCQIASKMLNISLELVPQLVIGKMNLNFYPDVARQLEIESVPCLLMFKEGQLITKLYAFQSVPYLYSLFEEFV